MSAPRKVSGLAKAQAEAAGIIRLALAEAGLLDVGTVDGDVVLYVRMSDAIGTEAKGVARDAVALVRWATEQGLSVRLDPETGLPVYVDNSISASRFAKSGRALDDNQRPRPAHGRIVDGIRAGTVAKVLTPHLDRLYRKPRELEDLCDLCEDAMDRGRRVEVLTLNRSAYDLNKSDDRARARMEVAMAAHGSDRTHDRILHDNEQSRLRGQWVGSRAPMGYALDRDADGGLAKTDLADDVARGILDVIRGKTLTEIGREWMAAGIDRPRDGAGEWDATLVRQRLDRPAVAGILVYTPKRRDGSKGETRTYKGAWEPIVDAATWAAFQAKLGRNSVAHNGAKPRSRGPFTGLFRCSKCGHVLYRHNRNGSHAWQCLRAKGGCGRLSIMGPEAEAWVRGDYVDRLNRERILVDVDALQGGANIDEASIEVARLDAALAELDDDRGRIPRDRWLNISDRLTREHKVASDHLLAVQRKALRLTVAHVDNVGRIAADWDAVDEEEKGRLLGYAYPYGIDVAPGYGRRDLDARLTARDEPVEEAVA